MKQVIQGQSSIAKRIENLLNFAQSPIPVSHQTMNILSQVRNHASLLIISLAAEEIFHQAKAASASNIPPLEAVRPVQSENFSLLMNSYSKTN